MMRTNQCFRKFTCVITLHLIVVNMIIASESFGISRMLPYEYVFNKYGSAEPQCVLEFYGDCLVAYSKGVQTFYDVSVSQHQQIIVVDRIIGCREAWTHHFIDMDFQMLQSAPNSLFSIGDTIRFDQHGETLWCNHRFYCSVVGKLSEYANERNWRITQSMMISNKRKKYDFRPENPDRMMYKFNGINKLYVPFYFSDCNERRLKLQFLSQHTIKVGNYPTQKQELAFTDYYRIRILPVKDTANRIRSNMGGLAIQPERCDKPITYVIDSIISSDRKSPLHGIQTEPFLIDGKFDNQSNVMPQLSIGDTIYTFVNEDRLCVNGILFKRSPGYIDCLFNYEERNKFGY